MTSQEIDEDEAHPYDPLDFFRKQSRTDQRKLLRGVRLENLDKQTSFNILFYTEQETEENRFAVLSGDSTASFLVADTVRSRVRQMIDIYQNGDKQEDKTQLVSSEPRHLRPNRHPQRDFFIADILDAVPKDDLASMEHPLFVLKAGNYNVRTYERNGVKVTIKPGHDGCATIHDKDVWIYCISQLVEAMNRGRDDVDRTVRFTAYDFLVTTNRQTSGHGYKLMENALGRLKGTVIETNIETNEKRERAGFGLIDSWRVIERERDRMVAVEVTLPDWLWRSVQAKHVLTLSRDYFRIRKPMDRRIYELARKHCGAQPRWRITIKTLYEKSGCGDTLRNFRVAVKKLATSNELPDYRMLFDMEGDAVTFYARAEKGRKAQIADILGKRKSIKRLV